MVIRNSIVGWGLCALLVTAGCSGGSSSDGSVEETVSVSSLNSLPDLSTLVSGDSSNASVSASQSAVTDTDAVPLLKNLSEDNIDQYIWNGALADLADADPATITPEMRNSFWKPMGTCRTAQGIGYAFQDVMEMASSLCYMKNAPTADSGVSIVSGDITDPSTLFDQQSATRTVKVEATTPQGNENIFLRVYGSATTEGHNSYRVDIWHCEDANATSFNREIITVDRSAGTLTQDNYEHRDADAFHVVVSAHLKEESDGSVIFDPAEQKVATITNVNADMNFSFKSQVTINSNTLTAKNAMNYAYSFDNGSGTGSSKDKIVSTFTGTNMSNMKFLEAGYSFIQTDQNDGGTFSFSEDGASEFNGTYYAAVESGDLFEAVNGFDFSSDDFYDDATDISIGEATEASLASYSCSSTPDIVVTLDMTDPGMQPVVEQCDSPFEDMDFCRGDSVQQAQNNLFQSENINP